MSTSESKQQFQDFYRIKKDMFVGQGQFGEVYVCEKLGEPNANKYCVKLIPLEQGKKNKQEDSINISLQKYSQEHPEFINFVKTYDIFAIGRVQYIVMEKCDEDLESEFSRKIEQNLWYSEEEVFDIIRQIIRGFNHLYKLNIIHRDIKPENILIKKENHKKIYKIGDFGVGRLVDDINSKIDLTRQGTRNYCAPQVYFYDDTFTAKCDIFSYGILFYQICYQGKLPYDCSSRQKLSQNLKKLKSNPFKAPSLPYSRADVLKDLIEKMIVYDEDKRASFEQVFNHDVMKVRGIEDTVLISTVLSQNHFQSIQPQGSSLLNSQQNQERKKIQQIKQDIQMLQRILEIFYNRFKLCSYFLQQIESNQSQQLMMHMIIQTIAKHQLEYALAMIYIRPFDIHPQIQQDNNQLDLIQKLRQIQKSIQEHQQQFQEVIQFQKKIQATYHKFINSMPEFYRKINTTQIRNLQYLDQDLINLFQQFLICQIQIPYLIDGLKKIQKNFFALKKSDLEVLLDKIINIETNYPLKLWQQGVELNEIFPFKILSYEYLS